MEEINKRLDAIQSQIQNAEIRMDKRLDRLEDKIENRMTNLERDVNAFKKWTATLIVTVYGGLEFIRGKLGL